MPVLPYQEAAAVSGYITVHLLGAATVKPSKVPKEARECACLKGSESAPAPSSATATYERQKVSMPRMWFAETMPGDEGDEIPPDGSVPGAGRECFRIVASYEPQADGEGRGLI